MVNPRQLRNHLMEHGLIVEGDETEIELLEAYAYLHPKDRSQGATTSLRRPGDAEEGT
jgi:hypothetical protein